MIKTHKNTPKWLTALLVSLPIRSFAGGTTPMSILQNIIDYLTGDIARLVGILVVIGAGYLFLGSHQIDKKTFIRIVIGMALILGGPALADLLWG